MSRTRPLGVLAVLAALAVAPAVAPVADAAEPASAPDALTIVDPAGAVALAADGAALKARVVVRNDASRSGVPEAKIVPSDGSAPVVKTDAEALEPGDVESVAITVTGVTKVKGTLVVTLRERPGVRAATAPIATPETPAAVAAQPDAVAIDLVRYCPFTGGPWRRLVCGGRDRSPVWVAPESATTTTAQALGAGSAGQSAIAELVARKGAPTPPDGLFAAEVHATATAHGDYKPVLTLDPASDEPTRITVSVRARVWVGLALLAIVLGAFLGGLTHAFYEARRTRALLAGRLTALALEYATALKTVDPAMPPPEPVFETLLPPADAPDDGSLYAELVARVDACDSDAEAQALEPKVTAAEAVLARWLETDRAIRALRASYNALRDIVVKESDDRFMTAVRAQLAGVTIPAEDDDVDALAASLRATARLLPLIQKVYKKRGAEETLDVVERHFAAGAKLDAITPGVAKAFEADLQEALRRTRREALLFKSADVPEEDEEELPLAAPPTPAARAAELASRVFWMRRQWQLYDWTVFTVTCVLASAIYVVTIYDGKPWGSVGDFVTAFGAGFGGSALAGVAVFPLVRTTIARASRHA